MEPRTSVRDMSSKAAALILLGAMWLIGLSVARAEPVWSGPGWYQIADTIVGLVLLKDGGPFESNAACEAALPPNEEDADYYCDWLQERPAWDN